MKNLIAFSVMFLGLQSFAQTVTPEPASDQSINSGIMKKVFTHLLTSATVESKFYQLETGKSVVLGNRAVAIGLNGQVYDFNMKLSTMRFDTSRFYPTTSELPMMEDGLLS